MPVSNGVHIVNFNGNARPGRRKRKPKKKRLEANGHCGENGLGFSALDKKRSVVESLVYENSVVEADFDSSQVSSCVSFVELGQRNVSNGGCSDVRPEEDSGVPESSGSNSSLESMTSTSGQWRPEETKGSVPRLETMESLDWNQVMAQDPNLLGGLLHFICEVFVANLIVSLYNLGTKEFDVNLNCFEDGLTIGEV